MATDDVFIMAGASASPTKRTFLPEGVCPIHVSTSLGAAAVTSEGAAGMMNTLGVANVPNGVAVAVEAGVPICVLESDISSGFWTFGTTVARAAAVEQTEAGDVNPRGVTFGVGSCDADACCNPDNGLSGVKSRGDRGRFCDVGGCLAAEDAGDCIDT